jgi:hypothetical protein
MNYHVGENVMKQGATETYKIVATKDERGDFQLEEGFDYLIQKESDPGHTEQVFKEDIERI